MPADDSLFEKALARQLRDGGADSSAGTNGEAASDDSTAEHRKFCPDVEVLAAYHERSLANEEMSLWKEHIFSCGRCQEILSQLEATENILVSTSEQDEVPAVLEGGNIARNTELLASAPAGLAEIRELPQFARRASAVAAAASDRPHRAAAQKRLAVRYWIVPAGAIAAALLVWIAIHPRAGNVSHPAEQQIVENRQPAKSIPDQAVEVPFDRGSASSEIKNIPVPKTESNARNFTALDSLARKKSFVKKPSLTLDDKSVTPGGISAGVSGGARGGNAIVQADGSVAPFAPKATTQSVEVSAAAPVVTTQASGANQLPLPSGQELQTSQMAAAPPPPQNGMDKAKDKEAQARDSQGAATALMNLQAGTGTGAAKGAVSLRSVGAVQNIHMIAAPGGNVIWRVGNTGLIEESTNAGGSWTRQNSGVSVILDSGAAPSETVCWVFGHAGTILRTIDGGAHWTKIVAPIAGDIGGVLAPDALHATVWDVGKKNNFITADGGATWTRVANP